jgi:hypothetical protein
MGKLELVAYEPKLVMSSQAPTQFLFKVSKSKNLKLPPGHSGMTVGLLKFQRSSRKHHASGKTKPPLAHKISTKHPQFRPVISFHKMIRKTS